MSENEGRLDVCFDQRWGTIDGDGWTHADTQVACRQLGYSTSGMQKYSTAKGYNILLGECKVFVGEHNEQKRQGRLRLRVARGRMRTDHGRLMTYKHTNKIAIEFTSTGSLRSPNYIYSPLLGGCYVYSACHNTTRCEK